MANPSTVRVHVGTTIAPRCSDCGDGIPAFEVDGTSDLLCYRCLGEYLALPVPLTLGEITRRLAGEEITESERRALWGDK